MASNKKYWKSVEELNENSSIVEALQSNEFVEQIPVDEFLGDKENQLIVVATHGGTARCLIGHYLHLPMAHWGKIGGLSNARWSILQTSPKGWHLAEHNAGSILEPVFGEESGADVPDHVR